MDDHLLKTNKTDLIRLTLFLGRKWKKSHFLDTPCKCRRRAIWVVKIGICVMARAIKERTSGGERGYAFIVENGI